MLLCLVVVVVVVVIVVIVVIVVVLWLECLLCEGLKMQRNSDGMN